MAKKPYNPRVERHSETSFTVQSESNGSTGYKVEFEHGVFICTCPHFVFRNVECKHIRAVKQKYGEPEDTTEVVTGKLLSDKMKAE
jgi:uncharacterized Zn finger protein